jgi:hypothetical protein
MPDDFLQKFDDTVDRMHRQQNFGLSCYAFLSGIADNSDRGAKYSNSYAGHALDLCIQNVQTGLLLFCSRHWDISDGLHSIPAAKTHAGHALDKIVSRHREFFAANDIERDTQEFYGYFEDLSSDVEDLGTSLIQSQIRVLRTEQYAHLTTNSRDRKKALSLISLEPVPLYNSAFERSWALLVLRCVHIGTQLYFVLVKQIAGKPFGVQQIPFAAVNDAAPPEIKGFIFFSNSLQVEMLPSTLIKKHASQVVLMDALLDEDDWRVDRIIAAAQQR